MESLSRIAEALGRWTTRWVPSAFSIAVLLTALTAVLAATWGGASPTLVLKSWGGGFWELLTLSMQMALVMFTGYLLALTGRDIKPGDAVLGLASSGPHSNGYSLVRAVLASAGWELDRHVDDTREHTSAR